MTGVQTCALPIYEGLLGQEITDGRYFDDPAEADRRNVAAFEPYFVD